MNAYYVIVEQAIGAEHEGDRVIDGGELRSLNAALNRVADLRRTRAYRALAVAQVYLVENFE